jgi:hypothetical protein
MQEEGKTPPSARIGDILMASELINQEQLELRIVCYCNFC